MIIRGGGDPKRDLKCSLVRGACQRDRERERESVLHARVVGCRGCAALEIVELTLCTVVLPEVQDYPSHLKGQKWLLPHTNLFPPQICTVSEVQECARTAQHQRTSQLSWLGCDSLALTPCRERCREAVYAGFECTLIGRGQSYLHGNGYSSSSGGSSSR